MTTETVEGELVSAETFPQLRRVLNKLSIEAEAAGSSGEVVASIMENILSAGTIEDVFKAQTAGTTSGKDYTNRPFILGHDDITWKRSTLPEVNGAFPFYAMMNAIDPTSGDTFVLTCGGATFCAVLNRLQELDYWEHYGDDQGKAVFMITEKPAGAGSVLLLTPVGAKPKADTAKPAKKDGK